MSGSATIVLQVATGVGAVTKLEKMTWMSSAAPCRAVRDRCTSGVNGCNTDPVARLLADVGKFYHPDCVYQSSRTLEARHWSKTSFEVPVDEARRHFYRNNGNGGNITADQRLSTDFVCSYHSCAACALRLDTKPPTPFLRCGFCPKSYHQDCFVRVLRREQARKFALQANDGATPASSTDASSEVYDAALASGPALHVIKLADDSTICCDSCQHKLSEEKRKRSSAGVCTSLS